jgi:phosphoribosylanthranilate isomerase
MTPMRIKISGLTRPLDAEIAAEAGADLAACVFYARSPRYVTTGEAWAIRRALPSAIPLVGVFVDTPTPLVQMIMDHCQLAAAQLFGVETTAEVAALRPHAFKAVTARTPEEVEQAAQRYLTRRVRHGPPPFLLLHLTGPIEREWQLAAALAARGPLLLAAGALGAETAARAIAAANPWGLDVWDAVEAEPGQLDRSKTLELVAAVREASAAGKAGEERPASGGRSPFRRSGSH